MELSHWKCQSQNKEATKLMKSDELKSKLVLKNFGITSFNILVNGAR